MAWQPTINEKYAVVIADFSPSDMASSVSPDALRNFVAISLGDEVQLLEENEHWYRGNLLRKGSPLGVFPKSHVHVKPCVVRNPGQFETVLPSEDAVAREASQVMLEWAEIWKTKFQEGDTSALDELDKWMAHLLDIRRKIVSTTLSLYLLREAKLQLTSIIDQGNRKLQLDFIPRDENGEALDAETTSMLDLFTIHKQMMPETKDAPLASSKSFRRRSKRTEAASGQPRAALPFHLLLRHKAFGFKVEDNVEIYYTLYDNKSRSYFSESFILRLRGGFLDMERCEYQQCIFTDIATTRMLDNLSSFVELFLVVTIVRIGAMEPGKEVKRKEGFRRPVGVGVFELDDILSRVDDDAEKDLSVPIYRCEDADFNQLHEMVISSANKLTLYERDKTVDVSIRILQGQFEQMKKENPLIFKNQTAIALKKGFADIIMPGDVRNDLYLTISQAEFDKGKKSVGRNVEVRMCVVRDSGEPIDCIQVGAGEPLVSEYRSVIYYHSNSPKWQETVKIRIPLAPHEFSNMHVKFFFRHCSSDTKESKDSIFCFSYFPLTDPNKPGTIVADGDHDRPVLKYLPAYETETSYLGGDRDKTGHSLTEKFRINTKLCSTKLTQNASLLTLLSWRKFKTKDPAFNAKSLIDALKIVEYQNGEEIVKFLSTLFDSLFGILDDDDPIFEKCSIYVFNALAFFIGLLSEERFTHFRSVLDTYIEKHFASGVVHEKLIRHMQELLRSDKNEEPYSPEKTGHMLKALEYLFKFIVKSKQIKMGFDKVKPGVLDNDFRGWLHDLFRSFNDIMLAGHRKGEKSEGPSTVQSKLLKHFTSVLPSLNKLLSIEEQTDLVLRFVDTISFSHDLKSEFANTDLRLEVIAGIIRSHLFQSSARKVILENVINFLADYINWQDILIPKKNKRVVQLLAPLDVLSQLLANLYLNRNQNATSLFEEVRVIVFSLLKSLILLYNRNAVSNSPKEVKSEINEKLLLALLSLFRLMDNDHYRLYLAQMDITSLSSFLSTVFSTFSRLITSEPLPQNWFIMHMLQNDIILNAIMAFSTVLNEKFINHGAVQLWENFFTLSVLFLCQPTLQVESFSEIKREKILSKNGDKRVIMAFRVTSMWYELGAQRSDYLPTLVGPFLQMSLVPETALRRETIPIFYNMMEVEVEKSGRFDKVESAMIDELDKLVNSGKGDDEYLFLFKSILTDKCLGSPIQLISTAGPAFIDSVTRLLERLLQLRSIPRVEETRDLTAGCVYDLLKFYESIDRKEMYLRYIYKLTDLHVESRHYAEAGFSLLLHAKMLQWSEVMLDPYEASDHFTYPAQTHRERKAQLYIKIIEYFDKGQTWENAIPCCKELAQQYEEEFFDYESLTKLLQLEAKFYENIITAARSEQTYYRVGYYGSSLPPSVRNKEFVYRSDNRTHISEFSARIQAQFPKAQMLKKNIPPTDQMKTSSDVTIMILAVTPEYDDISRRFKGRAVSKKISSYFEKNEVNRFTYTLPQIRGQKNPENEFVTLWAIKHTLQCDSELPGLLTRALVTSLTIIEKSPVENAISAIEEKNKELEGNMHSYDFEPTQFNENKFTIVLNGIVDAAVQGGTDKYRSGFLNDQFLIDNPGDKAKVDYLRRLIQDQVVLSYRAVCIFKKHCPDSLMGMHDNLYLKVQESAKKYNVPLNPEEHVIADRSRHVTVDTPVLRKTPTASSSSLDNRLNSTASIRPDSVGSLTPDMRRSISNSKSVTNVMSPPSGPTPSSAPTPPAEPTPVPPLRTRTATNPFNTQTSQPNLSVPQPAPRPEGSSDAPDPPPLDRSLKPRVPSLPEETVAPAPPVLDRSLKPKTVVLNPFSGETSTDPPPQAPPRPLAHKPIILEASQHGTPNPFQVGQVPVPAPRPSLSQPHTQEDA